MSKPKLSEIEDRANRESKVDELAALIAGHPFPASDLVALAAAIRAVHEVEQDLNYGESSYKELRALHGSQYADGWEAAEVAIGLRLTRSLDGLDLT